MPKSGASRLKNSQSQAKANRGDTDNSSESKNPPVRVYEEDRTTSTVFTKTADKADEYLKSIGR